MDFTLAICMSDDKKKIEYIIFTVSNIILTTLHRPVFPWRYKLIPIWYHLFCISILINQLCSE